MRKKLLALLLAAALALSLLAGCGGGKNQSLAQIILNLLDDQYTNVTVEIDPDLEAALRKAVSQAETKEEIRAALEEILGPGINFRLLGDGQKGDTAWNLILYPGSDPDAAGRSAFAEWNKVFAFLPKDGQYGTKIAMIETENGYALLVQATVDRAGSRDDESTSVTLKSLSVTGLTTTSYEVGDKFDPAVITVSAVYSDGHSEPLLSTDYTITIAGSSPGTDYVFKKAGSYTLKITYKGQELTQTIEVSNNSNGYYQNSDSSYVVTGPDGLQNLFFDSTDSDVQADRAGGFENITITLAKGETYTVSQTFTTFFKGILKGEDKETTIIKLTGGRGLFERIGVKNASSTNNGTVQNITFDVQTDITITNFSAYAGAVAGYNYGEITSCDVKLNGHTIQATNSSGSAYAGGLAGYNRGKISGGSVTGGTITATSNGSGTIAYAGGLVGVNVDGTVDGTVTGGTITATANDNYGSAIAGGLVGYNSGSVSGSYTGSGTITATGTDANSYACAGGLVGWNSGSVDATYENKGSTITAQVGQKIDGTYNNKASVPNSESSYTDTDGDILGNMASAGTGIGYNGNSTDPGPVAHTDL